MLEKVRHCRLQGARPISARRARLRADPAGAVLNRVLGGERYPACGNARAVCVTARASSRRASDSHCRSSATRAAEMLAALSCVSSVTRPHKNAINSSNRDMSQKSTVKKRFRGRRSGRLRRSWRTLPSAVPKLIDAAISDTDFLCRKLDSAVGLTLGGRSGRKSGNQPNEFGTVGT
jgi:hypothetical protein